MRSSPIPRLFSVLSLLTLSACGGGTEETISHIAFKQHALMCGLPGCSMLPEGIQCVRAKLQASGVDGVCLLEVGENRTVSGTCRTPAKEVRDFRLIYYTYIGSTELQLASVTARLDLRDETREVIDLAFPADQITSDFDDDGDGKPNLREFCEGTDPQDNAS